MTALKNSSTGRTCKMWPSLQAIRPLDGSLRHFLLLQTGHRRRGAIWNGSADERGYEHERRCVQTNSFVLTLQQTASGPLTGSPAHSLFIHHEVVLWHCILGSLNCYCFCVSPFLSVTRIQAHEYVFHSWEKVRSYK